MSRSTGRSEEPLQTQTCKHVVVFSHEWRWSFIHISHTALFDTIVEVLFNKSQHASSVSASHSSSRSLLSLVHPSICSVSQPDPSRGTGIPALMQAALGSAADTHKCTSEDYNSLKRSSPARHHILHPSVLFPSPFHARGLDSLELGYTLISS